MAKKTRKERAEDRRKRREQEKSGRKRVVVGSTKNDPNDLINLIRVLLVDHENYWAGKKTNMKRYKDAYAVEFWKGDSTRSKDMHYVETSDAHMLVEGYVATIFSKDPSVVMKKDLLNKKGNAEIAQEVINRWYGAQRSELDRSARLSLVYENSFLRVLPKPRSTDLLSALYIIALHPWDVIVDRSALTWETQRYTGHIYYLTLPEARERYGDLKFNTVAKDDFFDEERKETETLPDMYLYVKVVEVYDLTYDEVIHWSPNYDNGNSLLQVTTIPLRDFDDTPIVPIAPLYFARDLDRPLEGMSAVGRLWEQFREKNVLRTYASNNVRRSGVQFLFNKKKLKEAALAGVTSGVDGALIGVDGPIDGLIAAIVVPPASSNFDKYAAVIEDDIARGSVTTPFSSGEASGATATEVNKIAAFGASLVGMMARERDDAIQSLARIVLRALWLLIEDSKESIIIEVDGKGEKITSDVLDGKFQISALDQGNQPLAEAVQKQQLMQLLPVMESLGVKADVMKAELIRLFDLPSDFLDEEEVEEIEEVPGIPGTGSAPPGSVPPGPPVPALA